MISWQVTLGLEKRRFRLVIDGLRAQDGVLNPGESSSIQLSTAVYLGSPPSHTHVDLKVIQHTLFSGLQKG